MRQLSLSPYLPLLLPGLISCELSGLYWVWLGDGWSALGAHALAVLMALGLGRGCAPLDWGRRAALGPALLLASLPLVGALVLTFVVFPAWRRRSSAGVPAAIDLESSNEPGPSVIPNVNPRAIREVLASSASVAERLQAVLALRRVPAQRAVPILRLCFADQSEDVRLLAFADLERRESKLRARLEQTSGRLAQSSGMPAPWRAHLERCLAQDHWELVYGGFVSGALEGRVLAAAALHAQAAFELGSHGAAAVLLARVALRQGLPELAWRWVDAAQQAGISEAVCAPLFAEAAYAQRCFSEVGPLLARASRSQLRRPGLQLVVDFWTGGEAS